MALLTGSGPRCLQEVVLELLKRAMLDKLHGSYGFLIDGFPRDEEQAVAFEREVRQRRGQGQRQRHRQRHRQKEVEAEAEA